MGIPAGGPPRTHEIARGVHWLPLRGANVYFVRSGESWVLIDAGFPGSARVIADAAGRLCGAAGRPEAILLTHGHPDHAGAAVGLAAVWDVPILALGGRDAVHRRHAALPRAAGLLAEPGAAAARHGGAGARQRPGRCRASLRALGTGVPGLPDWNVVPTPGHTPGHVAFFRHGDRTLITGDAVLTLAWSSRLGGGGAGWLWDLARRKPQLSGPPTVFTCDWREAAASVPPSPSLDPWVLAAGHGRPLAGRHVAPALRAFAARVARSAVD